MVSRTTASARVLPRIGQGTAWETEARDDGARDRDRLLALRLGLDLGMTLIDTAEIYGSGHAEELVGRAIRGRRRDLRIATKLAPEHSAYADVLAAVDGSLRRLGVDDIDLYQTHWPHPAVPFEETLGALAHLLRVGKVRAVGLSNARLTDVRLALRLLPRGGLATVQYQYNLADRLVERDVLPLCAREGLTLLAYSPLLRGRVAPDDARRATLARIAGDCDATVGQVVLAWLVSRPGVVALPMAVRSAHVRENATAGRLVLERRHLEEIDAVYAPRVLMVDPDEIGVESAEGHPAYRTVDEAVENRFGLVPSPIELASEIAAGEPPRPIKVKRVADARRPYVLVEGRLRFWAWCIARGRHEPIAALEV